MEPGMPILFDLRELCSYKVGPIDITRSANFNMMIQRRLGDSPIAVVVKRKVDYKIIRMFKAYAEESYLHDVFYSIGHSSDWLERLMVLRLKRESMVG